MGVAPITSGRDPLLVNWDIKIAGLAVSLVAGSVIAGLPAPASAAGTDARSPASAPAGLGAIAAGWRPPMAGSSRGEPRASGPTLSVPGFLSAVAASSSRNAWAVGTNTTSSNVRTLAVHWNGASWKRVTTPSPFNSQLTGVAAISASNAWAVGASGVYPSITSVIEHWNGHRWTRVASPAAAVNGVLFGITAVSASNVWAVGWTDSDHTLILHWNGQKWAQVPSPAPVADGFLDRVTMTSGSSGWAVGCTSCSFFHGGAGRSLILRWNGTSWKRTPSPTAGPKEVLSGVSAGNSRTAWAVGATSRGLPVLLRWKGSSWAKIAFPGSSAEGALAGVAAWSATRAWAAGATRKGPVILSWNGRKWTTADSLRLSGTELSGVAAYSGKAAWAVGCRGCAASLSKARPFVLHWNGRSWK
jgi:hypothetical protein